KLTISDQINRLKSAGKKIRAHCFEIFDGELTTLEEKVETQHEKVALALLKSLLNDLEAKVADEVKLVDEEEKVVNQNQQEDKKQKSSPKPDSQNQQEDKKQKSSPKPDSQDHQKQTSSKQIRHLNKFELKIRAKELKQTIADR